MPLEISQSGFKLTICQRKALSDRQPSMRICIHGSDVVASPRRLHMRARDVTAGEPSEADCCLLEVADLGLDVLVMSKQRAHEDKRPLGF